jgi:hypothetical protein
MIELIGYTRADLPELQSDELVLLAGAPPGESVEKSGRTERRTHADFDGQSLESSRRVAELIDDDPSIVDRALEHLDRILREDQGPAEHGLREWQQVLRDYSLDRLIRFLKSESARAARLRQSSPFPAVLTKKERRALSSLESAP